jgi:protein-disulfide isomerase
MATESSSKGANIWLALIAGLGVGFAVGREVGPRGGGGGGGGTAEEKPSAAAAAPTPGQYKSESEFPAGWQKAADLATVSGVSFDGLSDSQKVAALQALNEKKCTCGCGMESIAVCAKKDPNCPVSPRITREVISRAKQGKSLADLRAYVESEAKPSAPSANAPAAPAGPKKITFPPSAPRLGPKAAKVTIVEFSDFQCPFCKRAAPTVHEIAQKYPKDVAVVWMNQPLPFHDKAMGAAQAFMAAALQGKAWEMHDKLFENNTALEPANLDKYAQDLKLNMAKFKKDFDDPKVKTMIKADSDLGTSVGANGTPTFFINGRELVGAQPFDSFKPIIEEEIKKADELLKKGVKLPDVYTKLMEQAAAAPPPAPSAPGAAPAKAEKVDIALGDSPVKGPKNAPVTIVEFSDFQCPFCSRVVPTLKQIEDTYKGKVRIAFKNLPLPFHNNAQTAAEAALAAHEQGKFWEMHDKLFANQQALDRPNLEKYAGELGLDVGKFKAALDSGKYKDKVQKDAALGGTVGATGTPTLFVNGRSVVGAQPFDSFKTIIDDELSKAKK